MTIAAVVFDMDGVLIDSEPFWEASEIEVFKQLGFDLTREMCWETTGLRINEVVDYWYARKPWLGPDKATIEKLILDGVTRRIRADGVSLPGTLEAIAFIGQHARLALASSSYHAVISAVLDRLGLRNDFEIVYSAEDEEFGKPHPGVYLTTAQKLDLEPSQCLAIEDSENGLISAQSAGFRCVVVPDPRRPRSDVFQKADLVLSSLDELNSQAWAYLNR